MSEPKISPIKISLNPFRQGKFRALGPGNQQPEPKNRRKPNSYGRQQKRRARKINGNPR